MIYQSHLSFRTLNVTTTTKKFANWKQNWQQWVIFSTLPSGPTQCMEGRRQFISISVRLGHFNSPALKGTTCVSNMSKDRRPASSLTERNTCYCYRTYQVYLQGYRLRLNWISPLGFQAIQIEAKIFSRITKVFWGDFLTELSKISVKLVFQKSFQGMTRTSFTETRKHFLEKKIEFFVLIDLLSYIYWFPEETSQFPDSCRISSSSHS